MSTVKAPLNVQRDLYRLLLNATPDAIVATNLDGAIVYWNKDAESMFGFSEAEAQGRSLSDLVVPPDRIGEDPSKSTCPW